LDSFITEIPVLKAEIGNESTTILGGPVMRQSFPCVDKAVCRICPGGLERLLLGYGFKANAPMKGRENSALVDYAPLSGILILATLMCFLVFLIASGVKRSAAVLAQTYFSQISDKAAQTGALREAEAAFSPPIAQRRRLHLAPTLASGQSSGEASVMPGQGDNQQKLTLSDRQRIKPIWRDPKRFLDVREADMRKPTANLYQISGAPSIRCKTLILE
jgi:hypothetical protein